MKNVIITGGSSGIGAATATMLIEKGHRVHLMGRNQNNLSALQKELGDLCTYTVGDVRNIEDCQTTFDDAKKNMGHVDVLINNAGLGIFDPLKEAKLHDWHEMVDTNIKGVLNMIHLSLGELIERKGHVINLGSVASHNVFANSGIYCATKHAVLAISESLKVEHGKHIRITTLCPGAVNTPFIHVTKNEELLKEYVPNFEKGLDPKDIAAQMVYAIEAPAGVNISEIIIRPGV
jgi:NADP-dependent 3-hydroxy acid dehydrogenase YdfG